MKAGSKVVAFFFFEVSRANEDKENCTEVKNYDQGFSSLKTLAAFTTEQQLGAVVPSLVTSDQEK